MQKKTSLTLALGSVFAAATFSPVAIAADSPFTSQKLSGGYQLAQADTKAKDAKCGADKKADAKCGADKKKDGKCGDGKCGADKKRDAKCGADKKKDGKCGEAKCGADKKK